MRRFLVPLLLASAVAPAAAYAQDDGFKRGDRPRAERSERDDRSSVSSSSSDHRTQRAERSAKVDAPARAEPSARPARVERAERPARVERAGGEAASGQRIERRAVRRPVQAEPVQAEPVQAEPVQEVRATEPVRQTRSSQHSGSRFVDGIRDGIRDHDELERRDRDRDRDRDRWRDRDGHRWSGDWRRDRRYDWHSYRNRHSSLFRLGRYYDPYGWGYRRWSIGFRLWPSYYGSHYWLSDPWMYRLPPAYGPYRWVRYYDDAVLVNIYTGQVADVIYNFFW